MVRTSRFNFSFLMSKKFFCLCKSKNKVANKKNGSKDKTLQMFKIFLTVFKILLAYECYV